MFLQWKYRLYDFLLNTFRLLGRGDRSTSPKMAAGPSDTAESSSRDHPQGEYENQGPVGGTTTASKATTVNHCSWSWRKWNKTLQNFNKGFLPYPKTKTQKNQHGPWIKPKTSWHVSLWADLALHEDWRGCNKDNIFGTLQEQDTQAERNGEMKGLKIKAK